MKRSVLLENLIAFLNHDFEAVDEESERVRMRLEVEWGFSRLKKPSNWISLARALQREIKEDLLNVLAFWTKASPGAYTPIEVLVKKINAMRLVPTWGVQFVNPRRTIKRFATGKKFWSLRKKALREGYANFLRSEGKRVTASAINAQMKKTPIPAGGRLSDLPPVMEFYWAALKKYNVENWWLEDYPEPLFPHPGQGLVTLGQQKFYVTKALYKGSPRHRMYGVIIEELERGFFSRLRSCAECHHFFVARDLRQKFCTSHCMEVTDRRRAVERVRKMRTRDKLARENAWKEQRVGITARPNGRLPTRFVVFFNIATKPKRTEAEQRSIFPYLKALGDGDPLAGWRIVEGWERKAGRKASSQDIWKQLDPRSRRVFQE